MSDQIIPSTPEGSTPAQITNVVPTQWRLGSCANIPKPSGGLYVNSYLLGGAASGPIGGNNPPTAHTFQFNTLESGPVAIANGFKWVINDAKDSGRLFLQYNIAANNPTLEVGATYTFKVDVLSDSNTVAAAIAGASGITVNVINANGVAGQTAKIEIEFTVDSAPYDGNIRYGVGVTTNRTERMEVSGASIVKKPSVNSYTEEYTGEYQ